MQYYDKYIRQGACHWREYRRTTGMERGYQTIVDDSLAMFNGEKGTLLDIGCGDGVSACKLSGMGYEVTGVDIDPTGIKLAKEMCKNNVNFICSKIEDFKVEEYDYLYSLNTIEHLEDISIMTRIMRKIKKYGIIVTDDAELCKKGNPYHEKELYRDDFKELFKDFNLEEIPMRDKRFFGYKISNV